MKVSRQEIEAAFAQRWQSIAGEHIFRSHPTNYTIEPKHNLLAELEGEEFWRDLRQGDGNELDDKGTTPAKFCAAHSSSALGVNTFGYFRRNPQSLSLFDVDAYDECQFEKKLDTGISHPNLDFYARSSRLHVFVECKCLEIFAKKKASFSTRYDSVVDALAEPAWKNVFADLKENPNLYRYLDAAQLVKHYLGIRNTIQGDQSAVLAYVHWEPTNAQEFDVFNQHREELNQFQLSVRGSNVKFIAASYEEVWDRLTNASNLHLAQHVERVRQRYSMAIS